MKYKLLISILLCNVQITKSIELNSEAVLLSLINLFNRYKGHTPHFLSVENASLVALSENQEPPLEGTCTIFDECHDTGPIMSKAKRRELEKKILKSFDVQNQEKDSWVIMPSNK